MTFTPGQTLTAAELNAALAAVTPPANAPLIGSTGTAFVLVNIGSGLAINSGTLEATAGSGTVTEIVAGAGLNGGTITTDGTLTANYQAGTLTAIGAGLTITSDTLVAQWQSGVVSDLGSGLSLNSGTLTASGGSEEWTAGDVNTVGTGLTIAAGGTLEATGGGGGTSPSVIQTASEAGSGGSSTLTFGSEPTVGNTLIFWYAGNQGANSLPTGVDLVSSVNNNNETMQIFACLVTEGNDSTSWEFSSSQSPFQLVSIEVENLHQIILGQSAVGNPSSSGATQTAPLSGVVTAAVLTYGAFTADSATSASIGSGYTQDAAIGMTSHPLVVMHATSGYAGVPPSLTWDNVNDNEGSVNVTMALI
jgi:hypothetical protein